MKPTERLCARNNIPVRYAVGGLCEEVVRMAISLGVQTIRLTDVATKEALVKRAIIDFDNVKCWMEGKLVNVMN